MTFSEMIVLARALCADKRGVTAIEYGVLAALIIVVCVTVIGTVGTNLTATFTSIAGGLTSAG